MLRRLVALLCLAVLSFAKTPRPVANVLIHTPDLKTIDLKKFRGKTVVVVIFSTSCNDCVAVLHIMDGIQKDFGPKGLQVIGAAGDERAKFLLGAFIQRYRPQFPIGYISEAELKKLADISPADQHATAPILMFIDRWGQVREQFFGNHPIFKNADASLRKLLPAMMAVLPVPPAAPKAAPKTSEPQP